MEVLQAFIRFHWTYWIKCGLLNGGGSKWLTFRETLTEIGIRIKHIIRNAPVQGLAFLGDSHICGHMNDKDSGGRLNKKDGLTRYGDSHVKDKTS